MLEKFCNEISGENLENYANVIQVHRKILLLFD
jgi:hypothetical protein